MNKLRKIVSVIVILIITFCLVYAVSAEPSSSYYQNKQNQAVQNSQDTQEQLNNVEGEIDEVLQEVANLNSSILEYEGQIQQLTEKSQE